MGLILKIRKKRKNFLRKMGRKFKKAKSWRPYRQVRDRLNTCSTGPLWFRLTWCNNFQAYSLWVFHKRLLFKEIRYDQ